MPVTRHVTADARAKIAEWEGEVLYAYDDANGRKVNPGDKVRGTITIGVGHTGPDVHPGQTITKQQADALLARDLAGCEAAVSRLASVPLSDQQFGTLVSFAFNAGVGAFTKSTLLKRLNKGDYMAVPSELMKWTKTHVDGKLVASPGLVARRSKESAYWASGANAPVVQQGAVPEIKAHPISPMEIVTGAGTIVGPAAGFANSTGWINIAFGVGIVVAVAVIAAIVIKRQFFAR